MLIYRIEHRITKTGLYVSRDIKYCSSYKHQYAKHRPSPDADKQIQEYWIGLTPNGRQAHNFGFDSIEKLYKWFNKTNLKEFIKKGFHIAIYEVHEKYTQSSRYQTVYLACCAVLIDKKSIVILND